MHNIQATNNKSFLQLMELVYSTNSMTENLQRLHVKIDIEVLANINHQQFFERKIVLKLNNQAVLLATSIANFVEAPFFVDLLKNADTTPIGNILFNKNNNILRKEDMQVTSINYNNIIEFKDYLNSLKLNLTHPIYQRKSYFYYKNQSMQLTEYILPTILDFFRP